MDLFNKSKSQQDISAPRLKIEKLQRIIKGLEKDAIPTDFIDYIIGTLRKKIKFLECAITDTDIKSS